MAACPRSDIVFDGEVGVYHCWARCVRRAFLCGFDRLTQRSFEHRRDWIHHLHARLAQLFGLEVAFHSELGNHLHVVLRTRPDVVETWSDEEVARRWLKIAKLKRGSTNFHWQPSEKQIAQQLAKPKRIAQLRRRLSKVSWYMGTLCENIARRANQEDGVQGRFWETRYASRNLVNEGAILVCGVYVDLNLIRAQEARTPEESRYTSAFDRIQGEQMRRALAGQDQSARGEQPAMPDRWLCELTLEEGAAADVRKGVVSSTSYRASDKGILPLTLSQYLEMLDWTGRQLRADKRGAIPAHLTPILERLHLNPQGWLETIDGFEKAFGHVIGSAQQIAEVAKRIGRRWMYGGRSASHAFS